MPTLESLEFLLRKAVAEDASEIVVRVSSYDFSKKPWRPSRFQAIVRFQNAHRPWSTAVENDIEYALRRALQNIQLTPTQETTSNDVIKNKPRLLRKAPVSRVRPRPKLTRKPA